MKTYNLEIKGDLKDRLKEMDERGDLFSAFITCNRNYLGSSPEGRKICDLIQEPFSYSLLKKDIKLSVNFVKHGRSGQRLIDRQFILNHLYFLRSGFSTDIPKDMESEFEPNSEHERRTKLEMISFYLSPVLRNNKLHFDLFEGVQIDFDFKAVGESNKAHCYCAGLRGIYGAGLVHDFIDNSPGLVNKDINTTKMIKETMSNEKWYDEIFSRVCSELAMTPEELREYDEDMADMPNMSDEYLSYWRA